MSDTESKPAPAARGELTKLIPPEIAVLLGPSPVVFGESEKNYHALLTQLILDLAPRDVTDWLILKDIADCTWNSQRMQRYIAALVKTGVPAASGEVIGLVTEPQASNGSPRPLALTTAEHALQKQAAEAIRGTEHDRKAYNRGLRRAGLSENDVAASSYTSQMNRIQALEETKDRNDAKRVRLIKDYERRRQTLDASGSRKLSTSINGTGRDITDA